MVRRKPTRGNLPEERKLVSNEGRGWIKLAKLFESTAYELSLRYVWYLMQTRREQCIGSFGIPRVMRANCDLDRAAEEVERVDRTIATRIWIMERIALTTVCDNRSLAITNLRKLI